MFDVYRFSNMILANEHRSLGPIFFIEELTVIVIKEMSLAPSYTIYFLLKPYTA